MVKKKRQSDATENCGDSTESCDDSQCKNCPHITKAVDLLKVRKFVQQHGLSRVCNECQKMPADSEPSKDDYIYDITLWLCLKCGSQGCGRTRNEHALKHYKTPRSDLHCININTESLQIWCYNCDKDLNMTSAKKLTECVDYIKKVSANSSSIETVIKNTFNNMEPLLKEAQIPLISTGSIAKTNIVANKLSTRVKGLTNLGNTCFFNAVLQCLAQTPFLLDVIGEMAEPGEKFTLPGGKITIDDEEQILEPISGELKSWGSITQVLHSTLYDLSNGVGGGVVTPNRLLSQLTNKFPQFGGGDQHDSHELLRHLLEAVRSEDLRRYQSVILRHLNLSKISDSNAVDAECKMKIKFYGNQAAEGIMRAEQVFRGSLVSTLTCQDCMHTSIRQESFLDISLPISSDKPQPPRRRLSPDPVEMYVIGGKQDRQNESSSPTISKHQLKKERRNARKGRKHHQKGAACAANNDSTIAEEAIHGGESSSEQSDADVEDNIDEPNKITTAASNNQNHSDANGNCRLSTIESGYNSEKQTNSDFATTSPLINSDNSLVSNCVARATVTSSQCPFHHPRRAGRRPPNVTVRYGRQLRQCVTRGEASLQGTLLQSSHYDASRLGESVRTVSRLSVPEARTGEAHPPYNLCGALASFTYNAASHSMCNVVQSLEQTTTTATMGITASESPSLSAAGSPFRSGHDHVMGGSASAAQGLLWNELSADVEDGRGNHHRHTLLAPPGQRIHLADTLPLTHYPDAPSLLATTTTMASSSSIVIADATSSGKSRSVGCAGRSTTTTLNRSQRPAPLLKVVLANKRNAQGGQILGKQSPASTLAVMNSHTAGREPWLNGLAPPHGANHWGASFAVPEGPVGLHNSLRYHSPTVLRTSLHSSANGEEDNSLLKLFRSHISSYPVPTASPQCGSDASLIERGSGSLPTLRVERPSSPFLAPRCLPHQKKKWKAFCCYQRPQSARPPLLRQASSTLATSKKPSHSMSQDTLFMSPNSDDFGAGEYAMEWQPSRVWSAGTHIRAYCHTWDSETDEDAMLEALTITTSSSCAFGVGLEGLDWRVLMEAEDNDASTVASSSRATGRSAGERCIGQSELDETAPVSTRGHLLEDEIHPRTILTHTLPDQTPSRLGAQTASPYMAAGSTGGHRVGPNVTSSAADLCTHYGTAVPTGSRGVPAFRLERSEAYQTEATLYAKKQQKQMANQRALANLVRSNRYTSTRPMQPPRPEVMNSPPSADLHLGDPTDVLVRSGSQTGAELRRPTNALSRGHADAGRDSHKCTVTESSPERRAAAGSPDHVLGALTPGVMRDNDPYVSALRSVEMGCTSADNQIGNIGAHAYEGLAPVLSLADTAQPGLPSVVSQPPRLKSEHSVHMGGEIRQWLQNVMEASQSLNCDEGCQY